MSATTTAAAGTPGVRRVQHPRGPAYVHAAVLLTALLLMAVFVRSIRGDAPPAIAEIAPQAVQQVIEEAPPKQAVLEGDAEGEGPGPGEGAGGGTGGGGGTGEIPENPEASADGIDLASVLKCVGDPPRQIEDPQSPPCVPFWKGDNGGATSLGVTADEIVVAAVSSAENFGPYLASFFNERFQFYGRKLKLVPVTAKFRCDRTPAGAKADAEYVIKEVEAFASTSNGGCAYGVDSFYHSRLAQGGVTSITYFDTFTEPQLMNMHPHVWKYRPSPDIMLSHLGEWACKRLGKAKAEFARDAVLKGQERKYGIWLTRGDHVTGVEAETLVQELASCGIDVPRRQIIEESAGQPYDANSGMAQLHAEGVTSLFAITYTGKVGGLMQTAELRGWGPEWLISSYDASDLSYYVRTSWPATQAAQAFGLSFRPKYQRPQYDYAWRAMTEGGFTRPYEFERNDLIQDTYREFLWLASGIQMAGPNLTPQTFAEGLRRTVWPYPKNDPTYAGMLGANDGTHSLVKSAAEIYWSAAATDPISGRKGAFCYVNHGARHRRGEYPKAPAAMFEGAATGTCDSGNTPPQGAP